MGKARPVNLPSKQFVKKGDAKEFFKAMLNRYQDGDEVDSDDSKLLQELLTAYHPDAAEKIGSGIARFVKDLAPEGTTSCFYVERIDGEKEDFSVYWCIDCA